MSLQIDGLVGRYAKVLGEGGTFSVGYAIVGGLVRPPLREGGVPDVVLILRDVLEDRGRMPGELSLVPLGLAWVCADARGTTWSEPAADPRQKREETQESTPDLIEQTGGTLYTAVHRDRGAAAHHLGDWINGLEAKVRDALERHEEALGRRDVYFRLTVTCPDYRTPDPSAPRITDPEYVAVCESCGSTKYAGPGCVRCKAELSDPESFHDET